MKIVNSTENYSILNTNRLNASEALINKLAVSTDMLIEGDLDVQGSVAIAGDLGVTGLINASNINTSGIFTANGLANFNGPMTANGTLTAAGTFSSPGGYYTNNVQISSDYNITATDAGQHIEVSNPNPFDTTLVLPDIASLPGVVSLYFNVRDLATNNILLVPSGGDTFQGTVLNGLGGGLSFNSDGQMVIDQTAAVEGDTLTVRSNSGSYKWIVEGRSRNPNAFHP